MIEVFIISLFIVMLAFLGLGFNIFFRKEGKFPETEVGKNKHMLELGIKCTRCEELRKFKEYKRKIKSGINYKSLRLDTTD